MLRVLRELLFHRFGQRPRPSQRSGDGQVCCAVPWEQNVPVPLSVFAYPLSPIPYPLSPLFHASTHSIAVSTCLPNPCTCASSIRPDPPLFRSSHIVASEILPVPVVSSVGDHSPSSDTPALSHFFSSRS